MSLIENLPIETHALLNDLVELSKSCLGDNLVGVYLHGSLAMGCFNPSASDIDLLIVIKKVLARKDKQRIGSALIGLVDQYATNKLELSIVTTGTLKNFKYPTSYELHFSNENVSDFTDGEFDLMKPSEDADLAAHFVIAKKRGICLYGEPIQSVFPDVQNKYYLKSIAQDFDWSYNNVVKGQENGTCRVPIYAVLNSCRVLGFINDGLITSKSEGGRWAIEHLPKEYTPVILEALNEYAEKSSSKEVDAKLLKQFMQYANRKVSRALEV